MVGWRAPQVIQRNYALPDGLWYGSVPELLVDHRGEGVESMIDDIEAAVASYPYANQYLSYPGPNSNTFLAHIGRQVKTLKLDLPANAIGKDYRPLTSLVGVSSSGSGLQISLLGLLGVSVGVQEGLEFNLLGLNFGIDLNAPALRLPFWGRLGFKDLATPNPVTSPGHALAGQGGGFALAGVLGRQHPFVARSEDMAGALIRSGPAIRKPPTQWRPLAVQGRTFGASLIIQKSII